MGFTKKVHGSRCTVHGKPKKRNNQVQDARFKDHEKEEA